MIQFDDAVQKVDGVLSVQGMYKYIFHFGVF